MMSTFAQTPPNVGLEAKPIRNSVQEEEVERYESLMERQRDNAAIRGRMAHDLDTINNKVCAAATADLPEPPASALDERPMLRLVLTLQALEMREDHRLCKVRGLGFRV
ncbi:hypothetical protein T484DRAFT_2759221 [Baffinella frigidus]|nr:hypothetical protein T484DRAFT_2759221 [Cryptophyta sp. CCMP2293]